MDEVEFQFVAGIDPGSTTGLAVYNRVSKRVVKVYTLDFWSCYKMFANHADKSNTLVIIEAPHKTVMYAKQQKVADGKPASYGNRMMANAASNAREAELLADGLEQLGFEVQRVRPLPQKTKAERNAVNVKEWTGYEGSTNQHVRDAIMLCWEK